MKKILVPTDYSQNAIDALHYARAILEVTEGQLYIVNAYEKPYSSSSPIRSLRNRLKRNAEEKMQALKEKLRGKKSPVPFETYVREDSPVDLVLDAAEHFSVDLILMGTKGTSGMEEVVLGSTTSNVIAKSHTPVLAIPRGAAFSGFKRVTFATDLDTGSLAAAQRLIDLTAPFNSVIDLLHVFAPGTEGPHEALAELDAQLKKTDREVHNYLLANESVRDGLLEHMSQHPSEAIAMLTRRRTLLQKLFDPSLTKKVATHAETPLLALHEY
ncbi:MAG: universal stress protein [Bacteroidota bacterium]